MKKTQSKQARRDAHEPRLQDLLLVILVWYDLSLSLLSVSLLHQTRSHALAQT